MTIEREVSFRGVPLWRKEIKPRTSFQLEFQELIRPESDREETEAIVDLIEIESIDSVVVRAVLCSYLKNKSQLTGVNPRLLGETFYVRDAINEINLQIKSSKISQQRITWRPEDPRDQRRPVLKGVKTLFSRVLATKQPRHFFLKSV